MRDSCNGFGLRPRACHVAPKGFPLMVSRLAMFKKLEVHAWLKLVQIVCTQHLVQT